MIRVAFTIPSFGTGWLGGVNYFRCLLSAIAAQQKPQLEPVLVVAPGQEAHAREVFGESFEVLSTALVQRGQLSHLMRRGLEFVVRNDWAMDCFFSKKGIQVSSHGPALGPRCRTSSVFWIPDFQHLHLPSYFSESEINRRNRINAQACSRADCILLSSESARKDLLAFLPSAIQKIKVLNFVPKIDVENIPSITELEQTHNFTGKYIFLPNQLWAHKNHNTVLEAVSALAMAQREVKIICTGAQKDDRNPGHGPRFLATIAARGLEKSVMHLGVIPYAHMVGLMAHSHAVLNPSEFEGWSTTVEEAKILGKPLILSDLPVHRDQAGESAVYFQPLCVEECAEVIWKSWNSVPVGFDVGYVENNRRASRDFGKKFTEIIMEIA